MRLCSRALVTISSAIGRRASSCSVVAIRVIRPMVGTSIIARSSVYWSRSRSLTSVTRKPLLRTGSTRPSRARSSIASRTGVAEMPKFGGETGGRVDAARAQFTRDQGGAQRVADLVAQPFLGRDEIALLQVTHCISSERWRGVPAYNVTFSMPGRAGAFGSGGPVVRTTTGPPRSVSASAAQRPLAAVRRRACRRLLQISTGPKEQFMSARLFDAAPARSRMK